METHIDDESLQLHNVRTFIRRIRDDEAPDFNEESKTGTVLAWYVHYGDHVYSYVNQSIGDEQQRHYVGSIEASQLEGLDEQSKHESILGSSRETYYRSTDLEEYMCRLIGVRPASVGVVRIKRTESRGTATGNEPRPAGLNPQQRQELIARTEAQAESIKAIINHQVQLLGISEQAVRRLQLWRMGMPLTVEDEAILLSPSDVSIEGSSVAIRWITGESPWQIAKLQHETRQALEAHFGDNYAWLLDLPWQKSDELEITESTNKLRRYQQY